MLSLPTGIESDVIDGMERDSDGEINNYEFTIAFLAQDTLTDIWADSDDPTEADEATWY